MKSKSRSEAEKVPDMTIPECIYQLQLINTNVFSLKMGMQNLIEAVDDGNIEHCRQVVKVFKLKEILKNLSPKE